jgi:hypothetical protein
MSFVNEFRDLMTQTIRHRPLTGRDTYAKPTYGTEVSYKGRVVYKHQKVSSARSQGQDVLSTGYVIFAGLPTIKADDQITLPDGSTPLIQSWERQTDETGEIYVKVYFG